MGKHLIPNGTGEGSLAGMPARRITRAMSVVENAAHAPLTKKAKRTQPPTAKSSNGTAQTPAVETINGVTTMTQSDENAFGCVVVTNTLLVKNLIRKTDMMLERDGTYLRVLQQNFWLRTENQKQKVVIDDLKKRIQELENSRIPNDLINFNAANDRAVGEMVRIHGDGDLMDRGEIPNQQRAERI